MVFVYIIATFLFALSLTFGSLLIYLLLGPFGFLVTIFAGTLIARRWLAVVLAISWQVMANVVMNISIPIDLSKGWSLISVNSKFIPEIIAAAVVSYTLNFYLNRLRSDADAPVPAYVDDEDDEDAW
ncbi:MAG: hypothetical protein ABFD81_18930 [Syntrophaceae bacterium]